MISVALKNAPGNPLSATPNETSVSNVNVNNPFPGNGTTISNPATAATPIAKRVNISSVNFSSYPQEYSKISLSTNLKTGEIIDITGWKIKSNRNEIEIPKAVELYDPSGFSANGDIILKQGNYVDLYSSAGSFNKNIRLNKCFGYLEGIYNFQPAYVPSNCPVFSPSDARQLSGQCQNYVLSLSSCRLPDTVFYNSLPGNDQGNACRSFLNNIGYGSCFRSHQNDADFLSSNWIVWLNSQIFDSHHDYVRLYDGQGNLMAEYTY